MVFRPDRRLNPFPGRQGVRFRRKLLARVSKLAVRCHRTSETPTGGEAAEKEESAGNERRQTQLASRKCHEDGTRIQDQDSSEKLEAVSVARKRPRLELSPVVEEDDSTIENELPEEPFMAETRQISEAIEILTDQPQVVDPAPHDRNRLEEKQEDAVVPGDGADPHEVYFDEATGLIEVVGVPIPEVSPVDQSSDVRNQVETMLAEWEHFSNAGVVTFDAP